ncbi:MAG TPA: hypothetical protein ENN80_10115 [Candidatus Hydrogenedentes bacterium]|nr:hypothetical protein [Candidatus Hydrogenedentota bacterium]
MMHFLRRHQRQIMIGIVILIVPMFVVWGGYRSKAGRDQAAGEDIKGQVARVGSTAIPAGDFRRQLRAEASRRGQYGEQPTLEEMAQDGSANRVLDRLVDAALLEEVEAQREFQCTRDYLVERLKKEPSFQTEDGRFDAMAWNAFVDAGKDRNWNAIYASVNAQVKREVLLEAVKASGRVLEPAIHDEFEQQHSTVQVKLVKIEPEIVASEEEVQAQYDEDPTRYQQPERRVAEFVAVSLEPPRPELLDDLVKRAREGEDFAELAKEHSQGFRAAQGGDLGWIALSEKLPEHQKALFEMDKGEVSDPVKGGTSYFIYKVEDTRTNEDIQTPEVSVRQIQLRPQLAPEERVSRTNEAEQILAEAKESGDLAAVAAKHGIEVQRSGQFSIESEDIEHVPDIDRRTWLRVLENVPEGEFAELITGREHLYVARVVEVEPPVIRPLDEVRERVEEDAIRKIRNSDEYAEKVEALAREIAEKASSLEAIQELYPELEIEIEEPKPFTPKEEVFVPGALIRSSDLYERLKDKEPGAFVGPIKGLRAPQYFVELVKVEPPSEENWPPEKREEELKTLRESALARAQTQRIGDYLKYLKTQVPVEYDNVTFARVITGDRPTEPEQPAEESDEPSEEAAESEEPEAVE